MSLKGKLFVQVPDDRTCLCILEMHGFPDGIIVPNSIRGAVFVAAPLFRHNYSGIECHTIIFRCVGFDKECDNGYLGIAGACSDFTSEEFSELTMGMMSKFFGGNKPQVISLPTVGLN